MPKHTSPAPEFDSTLQLVEEMVESPASILVALRPSREFGKVYVCVEVQWTFQDGRSSIVRREGEVVSSKSDGQVKGAMYRSAFRLRHWLERVPMPERMRLIEWEAQMVVPA